MKRAPLTLNQLFRLSWWVLVFSFVASMIDWYFLDSEYRDYLRIVGIISFAGYLIGLVANMQSKTQQGKDAASASKEKDEP